MGLLLGPVVLLLVRVQQVALEADQLSRGQQETAEAVEVMIVANHQVLVDAEEVVAKTEIKVAPAEIKDLAVVKDMMEVAVVHGVELVVAAWAAVVVMVLQVAVVLVALERLTL
jgi:hypothetical protein